MTYILAIILVLILITLVTYPLSQRKLKSLTISVDGPLRSDADVIISNKPLVVNVIYSSAEEFDQHALADFVINYKDLLSGNYKYDSSPGKEKEKPKTVSSTKPGHEPEAASAPESDLEIPRPESIDDTDLVDLENMNFNF